MHKRILAIFVYVSMFSIFPVAKLAYSDPASDTIIVGTDPPITWNNVETTFFNLEKFILARKSDIVDFKSVIGDLNGTWDDYERAVKNENDAIIGDAFGHLIKAIAAIPFTGGTSTTDVLISSGSIVFDAFNDYQRASKTDTLELARDTHLEGFKKILPAYEAMNAYHKSEYEKYTDFYINQYLATQVGHDGGLYTSVNGSVLSQEGLYFSINGRRVTYSTTDGSRSIGAQIQPTQTSGYYHLVSDYYGNRLGSTNHVMQLHLHWDSIDVTPIEATYRCEGSKQPGNTCAVMFITPYGAHKDHLKKCGTAIRTPNSGIIAKRTLEEGCGYHYYHCPSDPNTEHEILICTKDFTDANGIKSKCGDKFRKCLNKRKDHNLSDLNRLMKSTHSNQGNDESADAGDSYSGDQQADAGGSPDCDMCTSTSECSTCSSDGGESTSTDGSHECASCTSTSECSACVATETSTSASETNTETTPASTSTLTAPGLYPVGASYATVNSQQMPSLAPGDTHTAKLITKAGGYAIVHWYLLPPGDSRTYGDELFPTTYAQGPTVGTEVTFNFTFPSGARGGVYKLTAYIYPHSSAADQTCYEYSYYIYVS